MDKPIADETDGLGTHSAGAGSPPRSSLPGQMFSVVLLIVLAGVCLAFWYLQEHESAQRDTSAAPPPVLGSVAEFRFTSAAGEPFDSAALQGKVWVANFIFTGCAAACPAMTREMKKVQDRLMEIPTAKDRVRLVSFSVDPENDRPEVLKLFSNQYGADASTWHFLTGPGAEVVDLSQRSFLLPARERSKTGIPTHSDRFALVDTQGRVRAHYRPTENPDDVELVVRHVRALLAEADGWEPENRE